MDTFPAKQSRDNKHIIGKVVNWNILVFDVYHDLFSQVNERTFALGSRNPPYQ